MAVLGRALPPGQRNAQRPLVRERSREELHLQQVLWTGTRQVSALRDLVPHAWVRTSAGSDVHHAQLGRIQAETPRAFAPSTGNQWGRPRKRHRGPMAGGKSPVG